MGVLAALAVALWKAETLGTVGDAIGMGLIVALKVYLVLSGFSYLLESGIRSARNGR
jgi:hypothetical protein